MYEALGIKEFIGTNYYVRKVTTANQNQPALINPLIATFSEVL